ncbi:eCIS core domain-containing protein [Saccharothrix sp. Mg75]|uniref:eCIS core domain-containing protein n=1 Tax=Saccharothrix sp. Mg75 TaxID=3445357 RepID=UPI003EE928C4
MTRAVARTPGEAGKGKDRSSAPVRPLRELREVLASPGHPIDLGLRRELETRLGHDFSAVRVHHDRDAAAVTDLLGADAVTVGRDIFFGHGMFRPETPDGRRLLVHELLHTAQAPYPSGAVAQGRDAGAVSLPTEPLEVEAERVARSDEVSPSPVPRGAQGAAWMRYATVDADRMRTERLDPATLVDRLVAGVLRSLRGDPADASRRVRAQLARFTPELRVEVLTRLERRLPSSDYARVLALVEEAGTTPGPVETPNVPEPVPEPEPEPVPEPEPGVEPEPEPGVEPEPEEEPRPGEPEPEPVPEPEEEKEAEEEKPAEEPPVEAPVPVPVEEAPAGEAPAEEVAAAHQPGAPGAQQPAGQGPPAGATPAPEGAPAATQPGEAAPERVEEAAQAPDSPLVQHGLLERPGQDERVEEQEKPIGLDPAADTEVPVPEPEEPKAEDEPPEPPALKPEDHLPATDLDVSTVPTADRITLPPSGSPPPQQAPTFPSPPPTKAEQAEEQDPPERAEAEPTPEATPEAPPPPVTEEEPPAEQPLDAEVGPEPAAEPVTAAPEPLGPMGADNGRAEVAEPGGAATSVDPAAPEPTAFAGDPGPAAGPEPAGGAGPAPDLAGGPGPGGGAGPGLGGGVDTPGAADVDAGPAPEASLEPGGGGCDGGPAPAEPEAAGAGGGCGGGGGGGGGGAAAPAPAEQRQAPLPDVSGQPPEGALATVATLPPDTMQTSLSQVDAAASNDVAKEQQALQAAPPTTTRPSGAPQVLTGPPEAAPPGDPVQVELTKAKETQAAEEQRQAEAKRVEGGNQAQQVPRPHVAGNAEGQMSEQEVRDVQDAVDNVPTTDPALNTTVGPAPKVELTGEHDPARTDEQTTELRNASTTLHTAGREESAKPMGEDQVFPNAPPETLTAQVPSAEGGGGGGPVQAGGADQGVAVVAQQERGAEIQAGVARGQAQMGTERQTRQQGEAQAKADHEAQVAQQVQENSAAQADERGKVAADVQAQREGWRAEQDAKVEESNSEATEEHEASRTGIHEEKEDTDKEAEQRQEDDNDKIQHEREQAEEKARKEKEAKQRESEGGGFFSWIASKVKSFFEGLLNAITAIFDAAVALVNGIIKTFASIVTGLIDAARNAIIGLINALATVLLKLCDVLALFFPELAARMRKGIEAARDAAVAAVNKLADALKAGVEFLLNKLAEALTGLLRLLEKGLKAAVEVVRSAVNAAIEFAKAAIQMLGEFAAIIADIASMGVGAWLGKLGAAAVEGIRNHLWDAIKVAVRQWFNEKVQAIVGLGKTVIDVLVKGCINMAKIGKMVWDAIIAALPVMIVMVVVERLVSLIVPAAGAVLAVVQGLMAAWGTISKIIAAVGAFIAFVKAVKAGPAACLFAAAVAAGVVALLEFITNFLMAKLAGAAKGVGNALKGMAKKIMAGLKRAGKGTRKAAGRAVNAARRGAQRAGAALRRPPGRPRPGRPVARPTRSGAPGRRPERPGRPGRPARPEAGSSRSRANQAKRAVANGVKRVATTLKKVGKKVANSKIGKSLMNTAKKLRDKYRNFRDRMKAKAKQRQDAKQKRDEQKNSPQAKQRRLDLIVAKIRPRIDSMLRRGMRNGTLRTVLTSFRAWYRLNELSTTGNENFRIRARLNPTEVFSNGATVDRDRLLLFLRRVGREVVYSRTSATGAATGITRTTELRGVDPKPRTVLKVEEGVGFGAIQRYSRGMPAEYTFVHEDIDLKRSRGDPITVTRYQGFFKALMSRFQRIRNKVVRVNFPAASKTSKSGSAAIPTSGTNTKHKESYLKIISNLRELGVGRTITSQIAELLKGGRSHGPDMQLAAELADIFSDVEGMRSISATTTSALMIETAMRGDLSQELPKFQMTPVGAQAAATELDDYLNHGRLSGMQESQLSNPAKEMMKAEMAIVEAWIKTLDIKVDRSSKKSTEDQLYDQIRKRVHAMYGTAPKEVKMFQLWQDAKRRGIDWQTFVRMYQARGESTP